VIAGTVRFDCKQQFANEPWATAAHTPSTLPAGTLAAITPALPASTPRGSRRPVPQFFSAATDAVVTTDFFAFDDATDTYHLQGLGSAVEMGDAVLGLVIDGMSGKKPRWTAVRNASDPQINNRGLSASAAGNLAAQIYERYGYWTTLSSALACWALVVGN
jgi:hypothetical protein